MGEVYRAFDARLHRTIAIKLLPSRMSADPEAKQRFECEAHAISSLNHLTICHLHDVGEQNGINYLVMEYLEGGTLAQRLAMKVLESQRLIPPSISNSAPTVNAASSEARNTTAFAISLGCPNLPAGICLMNAACSSFDLPE